MRYCRRNCSSVSIFNPIFTTTLSLSCNTAFEKPCQRTWPLFIRRRMLSGSSSVLHEGMHRRSESSCERSWITVSGSDGWIRVSCQKRVDKDGVGILMACPRFTVSFSCFSTAPKIAIEFLTFTSFVFSIWAIFDRLSLGRICFTEAL